MKQRVHTQSKSAWMQIQPCCAACLKPIFGLFDLLQVLYWVVNWVVQLSNFPWRKSPSASLKALRRPAPAPTPFLRSLGSSPVPGFYTQINWKSKTTAVLPWPFSWCGLQHRPHIDALCCGKWIPPFWCLLLFRGLPHQCTDSWRILKCAVVEFVVVVALQEQFQATLKFIALWRVKGTNEQWEDELEKK